MENYKIELVDEFTFKSKGVQESEIPMVLVEALRRGLASINEGLDKEVFVVSPIMANPNLKELSFGILENTLQGTKFSFMVSIKTKEYWDDIYKRLRQSQNEKTGDD